MVTWILLLIGSAALFFVLEMLVFPKCFLKSKYTIGETSDRGIRKYKKTGDGFYFLYEPNWFVRQFIKQYVIAVTDEGKTLTCKLDEGIDYIRYDVVSFDSRGRLLDVLEVAERLTTEGTTRAVRLPTATAYACVIPRKVDGEYVGQDLKVAYSTAGTVTCAALTVAIAFFAFPLIEHIAMVTLNAYDIYLSGDNFLPQNADEWKSVCLPVLEIVLKTALVYITSLALLYKKPKKQ